jgi:hypothetical protein
MTTPQPASGDSLNRWAPSADGEECPTGVTFHVYPPMDPSRFGPPPGVWVSVPMAEECHPASFLVGVILAR